MNPMRYRLLPLALVALSFPSFGQTQAFDAQLTRDGVTLNYQDARGALAAPQRKRIIDTFYFAY
ncbi:Basic Secretory protein, partial [Mesorhizobium sp. M1C.F.Ca.ET.187.01.1.1]